MDTNNWRPAPGGGGEHTMEAGDWRSQFQPASRQRIVNEIMDTFEEACSVSGQEGLQELKKIAVRFEEKICTSATSQANHTLLEEIVEINQRLIDTVVCVSEEDVDPTPAAAITGEGGEGTIVLCYFSAVALSPNLKSQYASAQMSPIQPLRLLVPTSYPSSSPILLDKFPIEVSKQYEDLSLRAKSRFSISLRNLSQPLSLGEIAKTWDACARAVMLEYAQRSGGGSFSSIYGMREDRLSAT